MKFSFLQFRNSLPPSLPTTTLLFSCHITHILVLFLWKIYPRGPVLVNTSCECVAASTPTIAVRADSRDTDSPRRQRASCIGKGGV